MRIYWGIVFSVVVAPVQSTYTSAKETRRCWRHPSGMAPVGASRSLRGEVEMPRFTFVPAASNTCCEPVYALQALQYAER